MLSSTPRMRIKCMNVEVGLKHCLNWSYHQMCLNMILKKCKCLLENHLIVKCPRAKQCHMSCIIVFFTHVYHHCKIRDPSRYITKWNPYISATKSGLNRGRYRDYATSEHYFKRVYLRIVFHVSAGQCMLRVSSGYKGHGIAKFNLCIQMHQEKFYFRLFFWDIYCVKPFCVCVWVRLTYSARFTLPLAHNRISVSLCLIDTHTS